MLQLFITSSLEKIMPKNSFDGCKMNEFFGFFEEMISFQAVFSSDTDGLFNFSVAGDEGTMVKSYFVKNVPVGLASHARAYGDDNYISHEPGLFPDLLEPVDRDWVYVNNIFQSVWITVRAKPGVHQVKVTLRNCENAEQVETVATLHISEKEMPAQDLIFTQWFHVDCIADVYKAKIFSPELWSLIEKYMTMAVENGINMILTPVFTPPIDTQIGGERPTVQLVKIKKTDGRYEFDFTLLKQWLDLCQKVGIRYFEMPPLVTQWGAEFTPKIVAETAEGEQKIFGWHVPSDAPEYDAFLAAFLPALIDFLKRENIFDRTYFHVSDEPEKKDLSTYCHIFRVAHKYLKGCKIIDTVNDAGILKECPAIPILATDNVKNFNYDDFSERWCYYCNGQCVGVSNRFVAMPSARNRSIGVQFFKYQIRGFLQWGYNFYYSRFSMLHMNPFFETDAYQAFPSGDAISVYPGKDGPLPAIGLFVFREALQDLRALKLLANKIGFEKTVALAETVLGEEITFDHCYSAEKLLVLRKRLFAELEQ